MEKSDNQINGDFFNFGYDEEDHIKKINEEIASHLILAENAAIITINGLTSLREVSFVDEPEGVVTLLMIKAAKNVRFAVKGLKLGYYSGASAILRSAYEDLAFAILFNSEPSQIAKWFRNDLSDNTIKQIHSFRAQQKQDANNKICSEENDSTIIKEAVDQYIKKANKHIHPSIIGLSEEFGIELGYFFNSEIDEALVKFEGDYNKAFEEYVHKVNIKRCKFRQRSLEDRLVCPKILIELPIRYDEDMLKDISLFAYYIGHRLLGYTKRIFVVKEEKFSLDYQNWHEDNKKCF